MERELTLKGDEDERVDADFCRCCSRRLNPSRPEALVAPQREPKRSKSLMCNGGGGGWDGVAFCSPGSAAAVVVVVVVDTLLAR